MANIFWELSKALYLDKAFRQMSQFGKRIGETPLEEEKNNYDEGRVLSKYVKHCKISFKQ